MIDSRPDRCNICGGKVMLISKSRICGRRAKREGSGKIYFCTKCGAYVSTHKPRPKEAMGILADKEMRDLKIQCHDAFDRFWMKEKINRSKKRKECYQRLAMDLGIEEKDCHFGYFDKEMLNHAYEAVSEWKKEA